MFNRQMYQRVSQREGSPHNLRSNTDEENSISENNIILSTINRVSSTPHKIEIVNLPVKPDDTLQALALRYRCTISELKRINKIDKENEIYAKSHIKVPIRPYSVLTETLIDTSEPQPVTSTETINNSLETNFDARFLKYEQELVEEDELTNTDVSTRIETSNDEINKVILNSICEPLSSYSINEDTRVGEDQLLIDPQNTRLTNSQTCTTDILNCSGDDWGLSWKHLLVFIFILVFIGPIIYVYIAHITGDASKRNATRIFT